MKKYNLLLIVFSSLLIFSCGKSYLETAPSASVAEGDMLNSLTGAETVLDGINRATFAFSAHDQFGQKSIDYIMDCLGDDFYPTESGYGWFVSWYQWINHRNINSGNLEYVWAYYYDLINNANLVIDNVEKMTVLTAEENKKKAILAQAYTYRGYSLYYLVQLYGENELGVPVPTKPNPGALPRESVAKVYEQIDADLAKAAQFFTDGGSKAGRVNVSQINKSVTMAIQARVALTEGKWQAASDFAKAAREGYDLSPDYMYGWNKVNSEWIWGAILIDEQQTSYGSFFSHIDPFFGGYCTMGNHHAMPKELFDFLPKFDTRKLLHQPELFFPKDEINDYFLGKERVGFKFTGRYDDWTWTNDYIYIKAGEMYLIEAEAEARLGNSVAAQTAINTLNKARTLQGEEYKDITSTGSELLNTILMYRRAELWGDGQRFLDIKRLKEDMSGRAGQPLAERTADIKAGDKRFTFLIPIQEMDSNSNMV
ncbi:MAG: RagB/SusD family nutrient uptake outer membrane protein, partial [Bacteroidales bacterium]